MKLQEVKGKIDVIWALGFKMGQERQKCINADCSAKFDELYNEYHTKKEELENEITNIYCNKTRMYKSIHHPSDVYKLLQSHASKEQERFLTVTLNATNEVINVRVITTGLLNKTQIHPREVFCSAITDRSAKIIIAHNHTSSNLEPSKEDIAVTNRLVEAGKLLGIKVIDHLVFNDSGFNSIINYIDK